MTTNLTAAPGWHGLRRTAAPARLRTERVLTDAEIAAQADLRSERLRTWLPTIFSVVALVAIAVGGALLLGEVASFGLYLVSSL